MTRQPLNESEMPRLLGDPDTQGIVLLTILMWAFGDAVAGEEAMDPAELWAATRERFGVWISEEGENKVNGLITALQSENFYRDPETFIAVCMSLASGDIGDLADGVMEELEAFEAVWGSIEVMLARDDEDVPDFSPSVRDIFEQASLRDTQASVAEQVRRELEDMRSRLVSLGVSDTHLGLLRL